MHSSIKPTSSQGFQNTMQGNDDDIKTELAKFSENS